MKIQFILLVSSFLFLISNTEENDHSEFRNFIENFSKLARVTNAISLQLSTWDETLKLEDVISELLSVNNENFAKVKQIDTESMRKTIEELLGKSKEFVKNSKIKPSNLKKLEKEVVFLFQIISKIGLYNFAFKSQSFEPFVTNVKKPTEIEKFRLCPDEDLKLLRELYSVVSNKEQRLPKALMDLLNEVSTKADGLKKCIENLGHFTETAKATPIFSHFKTLEIFMFLKRFGERFDANFEELMKFPSKLSAMEEEFQRLKDLRMVDKRNATALLNDTFQLFTSIRNIANYPFQKWTAGFDSTVDMLNVNTDLQSEWFKEKVAKGKDTTPLRRALIPFGKFSQNVQGLGIAWRTTVSAFKNSSIRNNISRTVEILGKIEGFRIDDNLMKTNLAALLNRFKKCSSENEVKKFDKPLFFEKFDNYYRAPLEMKSHLNFMDGLINSSFQATNRTEMLKKIDGLVQGFRKEKPTKNTVKEFLENADASFQSIASVFEQFELFGKYQDLLIKSLNEAKKATWTGSFNLNEYFSHANTFEFIECFEGTTYIAIDEVVEFLDKIHEFADDNRVGLVTSFLDAISVVQKTATKVKRVGKKELDVYGKEAIYASKHSKELALSFGKGVSALSQMERVASRGFYFKLIANFSKIASTYAAHASQREDLWNSPEETFEKFSEEVSSLEPLAANLSGGSLIEMSKIFEETRRAVSFSISRQELANAHAALLEEGYVFESKVVDQMMHIDLDFARHDMTGAAASVSSLNMFFDDLFEHLSRKPNIESDNFTTQIIIISSCALPIILILAILIYGCTSSGRTKYKNLYLFYFGKAEDFEKRWRYSCFMDRLDGKNALIDAVREVNSTNVLKELKRGAYINVYNLHGNTPLHVATKMGNADIVKMLIKNGADREMLNSQNKTAIQLIPQKYKELEKAENYERIVQIYEKYHKKKFRLRLPEEFAVSSFHIFIEDRTDNIVTNAFMDKFQSITSDEALPTTTHCVVKTEDEMLVTDQLSLLIWIFNGVIMVKESWMSDCIHDEKLIRHDEKYLVEKVKFKGQVFEKVLEWTEAMAKGKMPFLLGVHVAIVMKEYSNLLIFAALVHSQGGTILDSFPQKEHYNTDSHPYLHANLGPVFIVHDGQIDLEDYRQDPLFTLFTEEEFIIFMLKREVHVDKRKDPVPILIE